MLIFNMRGCRYIVDKVKNEYITHFLALSAKKLSTSSTRIIIIGIEIFKILKIQKIKNNRKWLLKKDMSMLRWTRRLT